MPENEINCQNLPCPQPVLKCKAFIDANSPDFPELFDVLLDNDAARQNVTRYLGTRGYTVVCEVAGDNVWRLHASRDASVELVGGTDTQKSQSDEDIAANYACQIPTKTAVLLTTEHLGSGDDELGAKLMRNFLLTLQEMGPELWRIICLNGAVRLTVEGNPSCEPLKALESAGVSIIVCGTCLDHFGLLDQKAVGETTNMLDVVTSLQLANKVIRP